MWFKKKETKKDKDCLLLSLEAADNLYELLELHKKAWELGYRNRNLAPDKFGMFRTKDIAEMHPNEVFLGGIYGLFTHPIPFWETNKNDDGTDINTYDIVLNQYKQLLISNIQII